MSIKYSFAYYKKGASNNEAGRIARDINKEKDCGEIFLFSSCFGTGKTRLVRTIINERKNRVL